MRLEAGNQRFAQAMAQHPDETPALRMKLSTSQHPFATVLACSDSRVAPELIFDQGLGDLFVVRVAGNIVDEAVLGSIEYAVRHLKTSLVVVLGHQRCGAVQASLAGGPPEDHIATLVRAILPAVEDAKRSPGDLLDNTVRANVRRVTMQIRNDLRNAATVIGARYDLETGRVARIT